MDMTTIITYLKGFIPTILTLLMMLSPAFGGTGAAYTAENPEELVASFAVVSDIHVETNNAESYNNLKNLLEGIKAGERVDAVVYTGDNVMNGQALENVLFYNAVRAIKPSENNFVVMGNHDIGNGTGVYREHQNNFIANNRLYLGNDVGEGYYYRVVKGCYMIFLSLEEITVGESVMSPAQLEWLKDVLDEATAAAAPILVFNHHPIDWFRGTEGSNLDTYALDKLLGGYDNLLYIHGHWHRHLEKGSFYTSANGVNCINLPRGTEITEYAAGDGIVVELYEDQFVVRGRNFITGEWIDGLRYEYAF